MLLKKVIGLVFIFLFLVNTYAQDSFYYIARIKDNTTKEIISNANIINLKNKKGTTSNFMGLFMIKASSNDFLKISYMGYHDVYQKVGAQNKDTVEIFLSKKSYQIEEVKIRPWTKKEFKYQFVTKEPPSDTSEWLRMKFAVPREELIWLTPVSFHNYKTSKERQIINLVKEKAWAEKDVLYKKIVKNMTHYESDEYIKFLEYCHFSKDYILRTRELYITEEVKKKYLEFESKKLSTP